MASSTRDKLKRLYRNFQSDDHVLVMINADPDAIAAAMAVKRLLWRKVSAVTLCSVNVVKRPDNIAMLELLGVHLVKVGDVKKADYSKFVIVDSQPGHHHAFERFSFQVIIDHHPLGKEDADFMDVRPEYGATASMMTEYLKAANIRPSMKLATALYLGIKTDTNNFERKTTHGDIKAFQFLFKLVNLHLAQKIEHSEIQPGFLKYFQLALETRRLRRGRMFVHLGNVGNPDICVLIADFFMKVNGVKWSIVSGNYNKKLIVIFRNDGVRKDAGRLATKSFGNFGSAGGHKSMARAEVSISVLSDETQCSNHKKMLLWLIDRIEKKAS